jgi:hypothetical protein
MVYVDYTSMMDNFMGGKLVGYKSWDYPLVKVYKKLLNMAIELVSFPLKKW